jgi:hypothetical protein
MRHVTGVHACCLQVREKIETSGRDARWEFSKATLFARSNYMAEVCGHLSEMVEIVDDFFKFLGPELKAVTGALLKLWRRYACMRLQQGCAYFACFARPVCRTCVQWLLCNFMHLSILV